MAFSAYKGSFNCPTTGSNLSVTGVGFQPKAVIFWLTAQTAEGYAANRVLGVGWGVSSTQRGALSIYSGDAQTDGNSIGQSINSGFCARVITTAAGSVNTDVDLDFVSMDSDGFTVDPINFAVGKNYICHYLALGGTDLTNAWAGVKSAPTSAISQGYTGVGFRPDCILVLTNTQGTISRDDTGWKMCIGAYDGTTQAVGYVHENSVVPSDVRSIQETGNLIHTFNFSGVDNTVAAATSLDADGFTLNFTTAQATARDFFVLALKGGKYKVATDTQKTSGGTKAKTGIGFQPKGLMLWGTNRASSASVDATLASLSIGAGDGTRTGCTWSGSVDNVATTDENSATLTTKILRHATSPSTTDAEADLSSFDSDGYTLDWTTADATAREFIALAFGNAAAGGGLAWIRA